MLISLVFVLITVIALPSLSVSSSSLTFLCCLIQFSLIAMSYHNLRRMGYVISLGLMDTLLRMMIDLLLGIGALTVNAAWYLLRSIGVDPVDLRCLAWYLPYRAKAISYHLGTHHPLVSVSLVQVVLLVGPLLALTYTLGLEDRYSQLCALLFVAVANVVVIAIQSLHGLLSLAWAFACEEATSRPNPMVELVLRRQLLGTTVLPCGMLGFLYGSFLLLVSLCYRLVVSVRHRCYRFIVTVLGLSYRLIQTVVALRHAWRTGRFVRALKLELQMATFWTMKLIRLVSQPLRAMAYGVHHLIVLHPTLLKVGVCLLPLTYVCVSSLSDRVLGLVLVIPQVCLVVMVHGLLVDDPLGWLRDIPRTVVPYSGSSEPLTIDWFKVDVSGILQQAARWAFLTVLLILAGSAWYAQTTDVTTGALAGLSVLLVSLYCLVMTGYVLAFAAVYHSSKQPVGLTGNITQPLIPDTSFSPYTTPAPSSSTGTSLSISPINTGTSLSRYISSGSSLSSIGPISNRPGTLATVQSNMGLVMAYTTASSVLDWVNSSPEIILAQGHLWDRPLDSKSDLYVAWDLTEHLLAGHAVCVVMHEESSGRLRAFLDLECVVLLAGASGTTSVLKDSLTPAALKDNPLTRRLGNTFTVDAVQAYGNLTAGVYLFHDGVVVYQCGSCIGWVSRFKTHFQEAKSKPKALYADACKSPFGGLSRYDLTGVYVQPNWETLFWEQYPDATSPELKVLRSYTQQAIRMVEQAVATYTLPVYFQPKLGITVSHLQWYPGQGLSPVDGYPVLFVTETGMVHDSDSFQQAIETLGISNQVTLRANANVADHWVHSPRFGKVMISIPSLPDQPYPYSEYRPASNDQVSLDGLTPGLVYVFSLANERLPYGPYGSVTQADRELGAVNRTHTTRLNVMHPVAVRVQEEPVLYVKVLDLGASQPMSIVDLQDGTVVSYSSASEVAVQLGFKRNQPRRVLEDCVYPSKPFADRYLVQYDHLVHHHRKAFIAYWHIKVNHHPENALCRIEVKAEAARLFGTGPTSLASYVPTPESERAAQFFKLIYQETSLVNRKAASVRFAHVGPQTLPSFTVDPNGRITYTGP